MKKEILMPKMFNYQKEIVENTLATTIIGNIPRGGGKDYILACKVLYERPKVSFYISMNNNQFRVLQEKFREIFNFEKRFKNEIELFHEDRNYIKLAFSNGEITEIYNYNTLEYGDKLLSTYVDMMLYSDCLPQFDIKSKKHISMVSIPYTRISNLYPCRPLKVYNINLKELIENHLTNKEWLDKHKKDDSKNFRQEFDLFGEYEEIFKEKDSVLSTYKENKIVGKDKNKLNFFERIGYNFGTREIAKGRLQEIIKENSEEIKQVFKLFEEVKVDITDLTITISDNFGIINKLSFDDVDMNMMLKGNLRNNLSELLLDFVANTYLKLNYGLVK